MADPGLLVDVSRLLLRAALEVPHNQQFLLLSEYCVPLYPPQVVWQQLASEQRSRVNACNGVRSRSTGGGGQSPGRKAQTLVGGLSWPAWTPGCIAVP